MFPKQHRLSSTEFTTLFNTGKKIHTDTFFIVKDGNSQETKFAVVVPKKISKLAVGRNRIRRQVYAYIKNNVTYSPGRYIVIIKKIPVNLEDFKTVLE